MSLIVRFSRNFVALFVVAALYGCMTVPVSERKAINIIPESMEVSLGKQSYDQVLQKEKLSRDPRLNALVTRVGQRIAAVANKPEYQWEFKVIDSQVMNAFCMPGGKIAIYKGILPIAKNEAGLATVMAHEVSHAIARHGGQRVSTGVGLQLGLVVLGSTAMKNKKHANEIMAALGIGSQVGVLLPFSRMQETEADEIGQILMARAGYDPNESVSFWQRFGEVTRGHKMPTLLSDHPSDASREENMRGRLPKALDEYNRAPQKHGLGENF